MIEVYVYTNTRWGLREYRGIIRSEQKYYPERLIIDDADSEKYWTGMPIHEGEVRGAGVWFKKPNKKGAVKAFNEHALKIADAYIDKSKASCSRVTKHKDEEEII